MSKLFRKKDDGLRITKMFRKYEPDYVPTLKERLSYWWQKTRSDIREDAHLYQHLLKGRARAISTWLSSRLCLSAEERRLRKGLAMEERRKIDVKGDGNCFFRAFSRTVDHTEDCHKYYRQRAVQEIRENPQRYQCFIEVDDTTLQEYCEEMSQSGTWTDMPAMVALANALRVNILLMGNEKSQARTLIEVEDEPNPNTVIMGYYVERHFVASEKIRLPYRG